MQFGAKPLFRKRLRQVRRRQPLRPDRRQRLRQVHVHEDPRRRAGAVARATVAIDRNERLGKLRQDQFAYEDAARARRGDDGPRGDVGGDAARRDAIYANPDASEEDYMRAADLEAKFAEYDGYTAEARAGELLLGLGIPIEQHDGPMSAVAPGWKLRVLLAQALFADPDILLLDEPTNNLDINTIRWLEGRAQRAHEHDGDHLARPPLPEQRLHAHGRPGLRQHHASTRATTTTTWIASTQAREQQLQTDNAKAKEQHRRPAGVRAPLLGQQVEGAPGDLARAADREDQARGRQALQPAVPVHPLRDRRRRRSCTAWRWR